MNDTPFFGSAPSIRDTAPLSKGDRQKRARLEAFERRLELDQARRQLAARKLAAAAGREREARSERLLQRAHEVEERRRARRLEQIEHAAQERCRAREAHEQLRLESDDPFATFRAEQLAAQKPTRRPQAPSSEPSEALQAESDAFEPQGAAPVQRLARRLQRRLEQDKRKRAAEAAEAQAAHTAEARARRLRFREGMAEGVRRARSERLRREELAFDREIVAERKREGGEFRRYRDEHRRQALSSTERRQRLQETPTQRRRRLRKKLNLD
jgi:hypothetical protein